MALTFTIIFLVLMVVGLIGYCDQFRRANRNLTTQNNEFKTQIESLTAGQNAISAKHMFLLEEIDHYKSLNQISRYSLAKVTGRFEQLAGQHDSLNKIHKESCENYQNAINNLLKNQHEEIEKAREQSNNAQRVTLRGRISEQIAPLLKDFPYPIGDVRYAGAPLDFWVFKGLSNDYITEVVLLEIKSGAAELNNRQKQIKRAVDEGRIKFEVFRIPEFADPNPPPPETIVTIN